MFRIIRCTHTVICSYRQISVTCLDRFNYY